MDKYQKNKNFRKKTLKEIQSNYCYCMIWLLQLCIRYSPYIMQKSVLKNGLTFLKTLYIIHEIVIQMIVVDVILQVTNYHKQISCCTYCLRIEL